MAGPGTTVYDTHRARWIEELVNSNNLKHGVEVGVFKGTTFKHLVKNCPNLHLTGIDVFCGDKEWRAKKITTTKELNDLPPVKWYKDLIEFTEEHSERATIYRDFSNKACEKIKDNSLDFVFIDASHDYKSVLEDIKCWEPKVKKDGIISGHDIDILEVRRAVQDHKLFFNEAQDNVWYYRK